MPTIIRRDRQIRSRTTRTTRTRKTTGSTNHPSESWPFPAGIGSEIPEFYRHCHIPQDDYYYLSFPWWNSKEETADNLKLIADLGLPFEIARSPDGCVCYRIHRKYENLPAIYRDPGPRETCPVILPAIQNKKHIEWRMGQQNQFPYLYKEWEPIVRTERRVRRRTK